MKSGRAAACKACTCIRATTTYTLNRAKNLARYKQYREKNKERLKAKTRAYRQANSQRERERVKKWVMENPDKVDAYRKRLRARTGMATIVKLNEWIKRNPHRVRANVAKRRADKIKATPKWADIKAIAEIYKLAGERKMHVDHIVPLRSPLVCGLHVDHNMQLLTPRENALKGNRYWPDMPEPLVKARTERPARQESPGV